MRDSAGWIANSFTALVLLAGLHSANTIAESPMCIEAIFQKIESNEKLSTQDWKTLFAKLRTLTPHDSAVKISELFSLVNKEPEFIAGMSFELQVEFVDLLMAIPTNWVFEQKEVNDERSVASIQYATYIVNLNEQLKNEIHCAIKDRPKAGRMNIGLLPQEKKAVLDAKHALAIEAINKIRHLEELRDKCRKYSKEALARLLIYDDETRTVAKMIKQQPSLGDQFYDQIQQRMKEFDLNFK